VIFTRRFLVLVGLGIVPLGLSAFDARAAYLAVLWNLLVGALAAVDWLRCPAPDRAVSAERVTGDALSVAASNEVTLRLRNMTAGPLKALVRDEPPPAFSLGDALGTPDPAGRARQEKFDLAPFEVASLAYTVTPPARGDFAFGDVYVRLTGPMGLVIRQGKVEASKLVSVYPNLRAVEDYELMMRKALLVRQGVRRQRVIGAGREFAALREYTPDDEYRTIDWKATARRGKVISRTFESEKSQDILLLIDLGRLMRQEIGHTQKLDHVVNAALMLAHVVAEADDRVGLLTFSDETVAWLPPRRGRAASVEILDALYNARAEPIESDYRGALRFLAARWRKRSLVVLFTDIADPESSAVLLREISQLASSHLVICVLVSDPLVGERARQMPEEPLDVYEKAVAEETIADRRRAMNLLKRRGVMFVDAEPSKLSVELVARYLTVKNRSLL
jgi:uncharacterized protein (DUF58 family)